MTSNIPAQMKALYLESLEKGIELKTLPVPEAFHGSAVVKVLAAGIISYHREIYDGTRPYPFPMPLVPGSSCIGRVVSVGLDATKLATGQLVFVDTNVRSRDNPSDVFLSAIHHGSSEGSQKLMRDMWRNGSFAEYHRVPLENCTVLDERRLIEELGYTVAELMYISTLLVPYGGLRDIGLEPGETIVLVPATGGFGSAGVLVAAAMGARVIAMGRNEQKLDGFKDYIKRALPNSIGVETVKITGDEAADAASIQTMGEVDAVLDLTPPSAANSPHTRSAILALKHKGRVSMMGFADITSSPTLRWDLVAKDITLKGKLMYSRGDIAQFVKMLEKGVFPRGKELAEVKTFPLEEHQQALDEAAKWTGLGKVVAFVP